MSGRRKRGPKIVRDVIVAVGPDAGDAARSEMPECPEATRASAQPPAEEDAHEEAVVPSASEKVMIDVVGQLVADQILADEVVDFATGDGEQESAADSEPTSEAHETAQANGGESPEALSEQPATPSTGLWPIERLRPVLEAVVFAAADPVPVRRLREVIDGATNEEIKQALGALQTEYAQRGIRLIEVAGGWQLRTAPEHHDVVRRLFKERPFKLSRAAIETLAVVAYRQPVTRAEVESVRGVDASGVLESLVERHLVRIAGRRDVPGRPLVYTTTQEFLETFGLKDLKSLPTLPELGDDFRAMAEQSGFNEAGEDRDVAILPLEAEEESSGDEQQAARTVETTDSARDEREHAEPAADHVAAAQGTDLQEPHSDRP